MNPFIWLILEIVSIYRYVLIGTIILSWLLALDILNYRNNFVRQADEILHRLTDPVLEPIRRILPALGGFDFSPIVFFLILGFIERYIRRYLL